MRTTSLSEPQAAVLAGLDTMQGLQAARILARHGIPVIAIATDRHHHACRTRVCREIVIAETKTDSLIATLREIAAALPARAVLYPCHDEAVARISRHRDALAAGYHVLLPEPATVEMLTEKTRLYEFARAHGFLVPGTHLLHDRGDAERAAEGLRFPAILKPSRRSKTWDEKTKSKAYRVESAAELLRTYDVVGNWAPVLLAQEWIEGGDDALWSYNGYFDGNGIPVAGFVARKLRQWPPRAGSSCLGEEARNDVVRDEAVRLLRLAGYRGLGYVEMKRDARTGEHYLVEVNVGRPTGRSAIAEAGGVELLYSMYCDALGLPLPDAREQSYRGVKWLDLRHDVQSALHYWRRGELTAGEWWRSIRGRKAHAVWSWSDPAPFAWDLWRVVGLALSARERARRNHETPVAGGPAAHGGGRAR